MAATMTEAWAKRAHKAARMADYDARQCESIYTETFGKLTGQQDAVMRVQVGAASHARFAAKTAAEHCERHGRVGELQYAEHAMTTAEFWEQEARRAYQFVRETVGL